MHIPNKLYLRPSKHLLESRSSFVHEFTYDGFSSVKDNPSLETRNFISRTPIVAPAVLLNLITYLWNSKRRQLDAS